MSDLHEIEMFSSKQQYFPWTKFYRLFEMPEVWASQLEEGCTMPTRQKMMEEEKNPFREIFLVMHGERPLGFIMLVQEGMHSANGHVAFRAGVPGEIKLKSIRLVMKMAFRSGVWRLSATIPEFNQGARYLICAAGFAREGVVRKSFWKGGKMQDQILYGAYTS